MSEPNQPADADKQALFETLDTIVTGSQCSYHVPRYDPVSDDVLPLCGASEPNDGWREVSTACYPGRHTNMCNSCTKSWTDAGRPAPENTDRMPMTTAQLEALMVAHEMGYFDVPRKASQQDIADAIGISHQAVSERLRRAFRTMLETMVFQQAGAIDDG